MDPVIMPTRIDLIWNITRVCMWNCANCCVDAIHVTLRNGCITLRQDGLTKRNEVRFKANDGSMYDQALDWLQTNGVELDLNRKLRVLDHLVGFQPKIDFSGGDPLVKTGAKWRAPSSAVGGRQLPLANGEALRRCGRAQLE